MDFISLHQHSAWSCQDGLVNIKDLVTRAKEYGMPGLAITDHGTMSGVFKFYEECKAQGINPIIGEEFYIANRTMQDKEPEDKKRFHLTVLAKNMTGVKNLFKLSSLTYTEGFYYKPRIDERTLFKYKEGLIVLSGCHSSRISQHLIGDPEKDVKADPVYAKKVAIRFKQEFGEDFYLEIQTHGLKGCPRPWTEQTKLNNAIIKLSKEIGVKVVLTSDSHYLDLSDTDTHEVLLCIGSASDYNDPDRWSLRDWDLSFPKPDNIEKWLLDEYGTTEYADNTVEVNNKVNIDWQYGAYLIPHFDTGKYTELDYFKNLVWQGLKKKCPDHVEDPVYLERIKFEVDMLNQMGYVGYFLIVQDYVNWAKDNGIGVGPSRGSCAGSLVAYLLNIIEVNPMDIGTLFERFINPERPTMPDIDVDFEDSRRIEVVEYVTRKYGKACVCNILVLGYLKSKSVFKDVARVMGLPFKESNEISSHILKDTVAAHHPLQESIDTVEEVKNLYEGNPKVKEVFDFALQLEGKPRNHGVHACGIIIAPSDLTDYIPLEVDKDGKIVSQFPPEDLEKLGLLKMDFLGLSTVSIIQNTLKYIPELNSFYDIPTDDKETFKTFKEGRSYFTFQFNTPLSRETCRKMQPDSIMELSNITAIARPGPMAYIPTYAKRKAGQEKVSYINKVAEKYFSNTYGLNIYQEQGMQYLQEAAGFTKAEADFWRKGVAKAKYDLLDKLYPKYLENVQKITGISKAAAEQWWKDQVEGGAYTFNLAHAYAYAWIGYVTCYLLTHYPVQYMSAVMNNVKEDKDKLADCFNVCKKLGIKVLPPNVRKSGMDFVPDGDNIIYGLSAVSGLGKQANIILDVVKEKDPRSLEEFLNCFERKELNKTKLKGLVLAGALDDFGYNRLELYNALEIIDKWREKSAKKRSGQKSLLNVELPLEIPRLEFDFFDSNKSTVSKKLVMLSLEKQTSGNYLTVHPLYYWKEFSLELRESVDGRGNTIYDMDELYGVCDSVERKQTKAGKLYKRIVFDLKETTIEVMDWDNKFIVEKEHVYAIKLDPNAYSRGKIVPVRIYDVTPIDC